MNAILDVLFQFFGHFFLFGCAQRFFLVLFVALLFMGHPTGSFLVQDRLFSPERNCQVNVPTGYVRYRTQQHQTLALLFQVFTHTALINKAKAKLLKRGAR